MKSSIAFLVVAAAVCFTLTVVRAEKSSNASQYTVTEEAWFEIEVQNFEGPGQHYRGRVVIALFGDDAPMTVMNFAAITKGYQRAYKKLHYKGSPVHRIVRDFVIQMGDITTGDGTGGTSIFGEKFNDEDFVLSHRAPGMVSMANKGKDTNGSQFFITLVKARWMDGKHVVFGKVIKGYDVLSVLNELKTEKDTAWPKLKTKIVDCGLNNIDNKYNLTPEQLDSEEDIN